MCQSFKQGTGPWMVESSVVSPYIMYVRYQVWNTAGLWVQLANSLWEMGLLLGPASCSCVSVDFCFCLRRWRTSKYLLFFVFVRYMYIYSFCSYWSLYIYIYINSCLWHLHQGKRFTTFEVLSSSSAARDVWMNRQTNCRMDKQSVRMMFSGLGGWLLSSWYW